MPVKAYLEAGQVVGTHGVRGELRVQPWCDSPGCWRGSAHSIGRRAGIRSRSDPAFTRMWC